MNGAFIKSEIRPYWQMAIAGVFVIAFCEIPLAACRGVGLIDWTPEYIPGKLIGQFIGMTFTAAENWAIWGLAGALGGMLYRFVFDSLGRSGWGAGMYFGVVDWVLTGLFIAVVEPYLPDYPLLLPSEAPNQSAYGVTCFVIIILMNVFFGMCMGLLAPRTEVVAEADQPAKIQTHPHIQRAA